jgi:hypothetical protein
MSEITINDLEDPATVMNSDFSSCTTNLIDSVGRYIFVFVNDQLFYSAQIDDSLKKFDEQYNPEVIDVNDTEFMNTLLNYTNKVIRSDNLGSKYFMTLKNDDINIKVYLSTVCQNKYDDTTLQSKPGIFRP